MISLSTKVLRASASLSRRAVARRATRAVSSLSDRKGALRASVPSSLARPDFHRIHARSVVSSAVDDSVPLSQATALDKERDSPLIDDINMLSDILANLIKREDPKVHELYQEFRQMGLNR